MLFAAAGISVAEIGVLAALYPAVWGLGQLVTGALSDRLERKRSIVAGMLTQAAALAMVAVADTFTVWAVAGVLLGAGTAMVYPNCWPSSATLRTRPGGQAPLGCTGCGETAGSPPARCSSAHNFPVVLHAVVSIPCSLLLGRGVR